MAETIAFLFSDLEGSTRLLSSLGPDRYGEVLTAYRAIIAESAATEEGEVVDREGDGLFVVFPTAAGALRAAAQAQKALAGRRWPDDVAVAARIGVHAGEAQRRDDGYVGLDVHRAARVASAGHGGQVLVSEAAWVLAADALPQDLALRDLGHHRLKDLNRVERLHQLIVPGIRHEFPPLATLEGTLNNLPIQTTSFVGRDDELSQLIDLLRSSRLVTVTGVGGCGKTRLALRAVAELVPDFDGVWLVELGAITDSDRVDGALLDVLGITQRAGISPRQAALSHLAGSRALILLDNCEHLLDATADLAAAVLVGAPDVTVVATSRELLGVSGEVVYGLRSMSLPRGDEGTDAEGLAAYDAVRLFTERAAAVQPGFRLTSENARAVVEICRRLDGMPLALELAAPRVRTFSPEKLATLLDQRFRLLTGGSRTALARQQTLTATIEWSYRLLAESERAFFQRLSVFQGGFTYEAAAAICTDGLVDEMQALELLPALVDKSLVVADSDGGEVRYRLLETIRQFARDRLDDSGRGEDARQRHARYFHDFAVEASRHATGPDELAWNQQMRAESDNVRQAMTWWLESGEPAVALQMAIGFTGFSRWSEALSWLERTLPPAWQEADRLLRARALVTHGGLLDSSGEWARAVDQIEQGIELFRELEADGTDRTLLLGRPGFAAALIDLAVVLFHQGRAGASNEIFTELVQEALEVARRLGDQRAIASALGNLAHHMEPHGDPQRARDLFDQAVAATRDLGSDRMMSGVNQQRAFFEFQAGELEASRKAWHAAIRHAQRAEQDAAALLYRAYLAAVEVEMGIAAEGRFIEDVRALLDEPDVRQAVWVYQSLLVFRAGIDLSRGDHARVAMAMGASAAEAERGTPVRWDLVDHLERVTSDAREALGDEAFTTGMQRGAALTRDEIIALLAAE